MKKMFHTKVNAPVAGRLRNFCFSFKPLAITLAIN